MNLQDLQWQIQTFKVSYPSIIDMSFFSSSAILILTIFSNSQFKSMSAKQFTVSLMTTEVHFRRNHYIMALSPVTPAGKGEEIGKFYL